MATTKRLALLFTVVIMAILSNAEETKDGLFDLFVQAEQQVAAKFVDSKAGLGITVSSSKENLLIVSQGGKVLVNLMEPLYQDGKDRDQLVLIHGRPFLDHRRKNKATSYSITVEEAKELMAAAEPKQETADQQYESESEEEFKEKVTKVINKIVKDTTKNIQFHQQALRDAITDLQANPHTSLIIDAAIAMGRKKRIIGRDYPPVLPFYAFARVLNKLNDNMELVENDKETHVCDRDLPCFKKCPPCKKENCLGMCSRKCSCWEFVCDTCCWQKGCCIHDICCKGGHMTLACLNVIGFTCNSFSC